MDLNYTNSISLFLLIVLVVITIDQGILLFQQNRAIKACQHAFGTLDKVQQDSIRKIVTAFKRYGDKDKHKLFYILATARHESNFRPIKERRANSSQFTIYQKQNKYWYTGYYGRGFVQLTHERNYAKMANFLGVDLVTRPELALNPSYAARILVYGMMKGLFTRHVLTRYINTDTIDYFHARRVVNGLDKASLIATYATQIQNYY